MKVELERDTKDGKKSVYLYSNDRTVNANVLREWARLLLLAARWLDKGE